MLSVFITLGCIVGAVIAQFPPRPEGVTVLRSKFHPNVTISYKQPGICETTPGVRSYSGYVHLPPGFLEDGSGETQNYPINTFFWFFEARKDPHNAPLAIWLNGGPGGSSMMGLLEENGPCFVRSDSTSTHLNPWSWNNEVNMLYIDQPTQVGFSYDVLTNSTLRAAESGFVAVPTNFTNGIPELNVSTLVGTVSSQRYSQTANATAFAAHALWHFAQTWFSEFPCYKPHDDRISFWVESFGGHYGPGIMGFFQEQNEKIDNETSTEKGAHKLHLATLGIINGWIDMAVQGEYYLHYLYNNTYDIQILNATTYTTLLDDWTRPGGCNDLIRACQASLSPSPSPKIQNTTSACQSVYPSCEAPIAAALAASGRAYYDIAHSTFDPFPPPQMYGFLTSSSVLAALGVPVNYTAVSRAVNTAFETSSDWYRGGFLEHIAHLLRANVSVHLVYGDRDAACNWMGGEAASLAVPWARREEFAARAGYVPLRTAEGKVRGMTRQVGGFSYSRVFQAGHEVPRYQPEVAYEVFMRAMTGRDVATGRIEVDEGLVTVGVNDTRGWREAPPEMPEERCYVLKRGTCTDEVWKTVMNGTALVRDWWVVGVEHGRQRQDL
ncbi:Alpha/Beta hydrolase protein [Schizothecium vesticola]|uniref:Alpha/Beta hydrolase protein n=1 Tax=Schizothecium vesticola TaxID=314040 RepID=A0AA40K7P6_9PEZI|nr:Alpha/Beta hydrolase protein [Schizothecium vesticola]